MFLFILYTFAIDYYQKHHAGLTSSYDVFKCDCTRVKHLKYLGAQVSDKASMVLQELHLKYGVNDYFSFIATINSDKPHSMTRKR